MKEQKTQTYKEKETKKPEIKKDGAAFKENIYKLQKAINIPLSNPIVAYLEKFDEYFKKNKRKLTSGEILFSQGKNEYFYIITAGILSIYSYTKDGEKKEIGKAYSGNFIGEGVLCGRTYKDVEAIAVTEVEVFALTEENLKEFEKNCPNEALEIYKHIIDITNKRLIDSGNELGTVYETTENIMELSKLGEKGFNQIIIKIKDLLGFDYIIYIENHSVIDGLFSYKFNTKFPSVYPINTKAGKEISSQSGGLIDKESDILGTGKGDIIYMLPLKSGDILKGFFVLGRKKGVITDNEMRILSNVSPLIGYIVESNQQMADEKARKMREDVY